MEDREGSTGFDRRRFIKGAATVAWATPLILTLGASAANAQPPTPSPAACIPAANKPEGCPCSTSSQCADGCCCGPIGGGGLCTSPGTCANIPAQDCA